MCTFIILLFYYLGRLDSVYFSSINFFKFFLNVNGLLTDTLFVGVDLYCSLTLTLGYSNVIL